ncbi:hypothetical protein BB560_002441 [Smittium megazygosporum]|uniref:SH3 domain-containing protein n=1 Tax=Smittium megazygosporum TaxID=133381 RepID=A0A2T9ZEP7_9FUNG|nr:hypothetical protein BB560_002441 [Smittium megazygosporum]
MKAFIFYVFAFLSFSVAKNTTESNSDSVLSAFEDSTFVNSNNDCFSLKGSAICKNEFSSLRLPVISFRGNTINSSKAFDTELIDFFLSDQYKKQLETTFRCSGLGNDIPTNLEQARNAFVCRKLYSTLGAQKCSNNSTVGDVCRSSCLSYVSSWKKYISSYGICNNLTETNQSLDRFELICTSELYNKDTSSNCVEVKQLPSSCDEKIGNPKTACAFCKSNPQDPCCMESGLTNTCVLKDLLKGKRQSEVSMIALFVILGLLLVLFIILVYLAKKRFSSSKNNPKNDSFNNMNFSVSKKSMNHLLESNTVNGETSRTIENDINLKTQAATNAEDSNQIKAANQDIEGSNTFGLLQIEHNQRASEINIESILKGSKATDLFSDENNVAHSNTTKSAPNASDPLSQKLKPSDFDRANTFSPRVSKIVDTDTQDLLNKSISNTLKKSIELTRKSNFVENKSNTYTPIEEKNETGDDKSSMLEHPFLTTRVQSAQSSPLFAELRDRYLSSKSKPDHIEIVPVRKSISLKSISQESHVSSYISDKYEFLEGKYLCSVYSYYPKEYDELELNPGDIVRIIKVFSDGWALVELAKGLKVGAVPLVCLDEKNILSDYPE